MWEESPIGTWTLEVWNDGRSIVELKEWSIAFLGTETAPQPTSEDKIIPTKVTTAPPAPPPPQPPKDVSPPIGSLPAVPPVVDLNNAGPKMPEQNAGDVSGISSSLSAADKSNPMDNCLEQNGLDWCAACEKPYVQLNGRCVESCPAEGYFKGQSNRHDTCVPCYYSCKTCSGSNDYEVCSVYFKKNCHLVLHSNTTFIFLS